uniref:Uncharacterized protein n=1 Tax=Arundo donax TaxID=35708 RepID=A0A0A9GKU4_ARUDO
MIYNASEVTYCFNVSCSKTCILFVALPLGYKHLHL